MLKRIINKVTKEVRKRQNLRPQLSAYLAGQLIAKAITSRQPFLASRLGYTEARCLSQPGGYENRSPEWREQLRRESGVFPESQQQFKEFGIEYFSAFAEIDLLGLLGNTHEKIIFESHAKNPATCALESLEPYLTPHPWSQYLSGRKVLVIHPFAESILSQYNDRRSSLFVNDQILPEFELLVIKSPQTILQNTDGYSTWNEAFACLTRKIQALRFDVAIIGCGAYGLPTGAFVKRLGKQAIHLGGATQVLFGISGKRWNDRPAFRALMTTAWKSPEESEKPEGWNSFEHGCYW